MSINEWFKANKSKYDYETSIKKCIEETGSTKDSIQRVAKKYYDKQVSVGSEIGLSESALRAKHDTVFKIRNAVKQIDLGKFIPDQEFREFFVKESATRYRSKADLSEFDIYKGNAGGVTYWGNEKSILKFKSEGILS